MNFFNRMSIAAKIYIIPLIGTVSFILYLVITSTTALQNISSLEDAKDVQFPALQKANAALNNIEKAKDLLASAVTTGDADLLITAQKLSDSANTDLNDIKAISRAFSGDIDVVQKQFNAYFKTAYGLSDSMVNNTADFSKIGQISATMNEQYDSSTSAMMMFRDLRLQAFKGAIADSNSSANALITVGIIMGVVTTILLFAAALPVVKGIKGNILQVVGSLRDIAQENGDLTVRIHTSSEDEIGELVKWFNQFIEKLQGVVKDIVNASLPLSDLAQNLNQLTDDTNRTIDVQQRSANQAKDAVDTMNASVADVADSAALAARAASEATAAATEGQSVVHETVSSIRQLAENVQASSEVIKQLEVDSNKVGTVLDVIKGIAEQTNLLALNAAIEAARAGEQGRGFAVVADEVRTLASRTQQSTEEIHNTIEQLQNAARSAVSVMVKGTDRADISVQTANKAGQSLNVITETINRISSMNQQIASATDQQQAVATNIVSHVDEIHQRTLETSESSARLAVVSQELADLATNLNAIARQFRV